MMFLLSATLIASTIAQQLQNVTMPMNHPQLSASCQKALNTSVSCPFYLAVLAQNEEPLGILSDAETKDLCSSSCGQSLNKAKANIKSACTAKSDVIVIDGIAYPATFFVDNYIQAYAVSCLKDSSDQLCGQYFETWSNGNSSTQQSCSDCWLRLLALQLGSPIGYDPSLASSFHSLTSSCNASSYTFTTPTAYALNATATAAPTTTTATSTTPCASPYTVQPEDDCISISTRHNVSTFDLLYQNSIDIYCKNFNPTYDVQLCLPLSCDTYTWQAQDTCNSVVSLLQSVTIPQFLAWNPNFNSLCQNSAGFHGYQVCVGPPGGLLNSTGNSNTSDSTTATVAAPVPTNARDGSNRRCGRWHTIIPGDTCAAVSMAMSISLEDFYFLNPTIDANCTNLLLDIAYCVEPVGNIQTYASYTGTGLPITVSPATFPSVNTAIPTKTGDPGFEYTMSLLPTASGTKANCQTYMNVDNTSSRNDCDYVAFAYGVSIEQLQQWNPSLSQNASICTLAPGFSYCVEINQTDTSTSPSYCIPINATSIMPGTDSSCNCFMVVHDYDQKAYTCSDLETDYAVTHENLLKWNPWLESDCDSNLYNNLAEGIARPVCVGVNASAPVGSAIPGPSTTTSRFGSSVSGVTGPTQTGIVAGCQRYYTVQAGDTCYGMEIIFGVTFEQLFAWNPSIGDDCENLWLGYAYCVAGPLGAKRVV